MRGLGRGAAVLLVPALLLQGCARDAYVVRTASALAETGQPVVEAATRALDAVAEGSREAGAAIAVADASCDWPELLVARVPQASGALCVTDPAAAIPIRPLERARFAPTLALLSAFGAYVGAVQAIVAEEPFDSDIALDAALADLEGLVGDVAVIAGAPRPGLLTDAQFEAAKGLTALVVTLRTERDQARRLRSVQAHAPQVERLARILEQDIARWVELGLVSDLETIRTVQRIQWNRARSVAGSSGGEAPGSEAARELLIWQAIAVEDRIRLARLLPVEMNRALAATRSAHAAYLAALGERELTEAQRRQVAAIAAARLRAVLRGVASGLAAFI